MNDFNALLRTVISEAKAVGVPVSDNIDNRVRVNDRAITRFGKCTYTGGRYIIELSEILLDASEMSCRQTIAHELIHTCPDCMNHGLKFRKYADIMNRKYGYNISRTNSEEELGIERDISYQYIIVCQKCGMKIGRTKRTSLVEHPERYKCKCGGNLRVFNMQKSERPDKMSVAEPKYILLCSSCGAKIGRQRLSEAVKNPSHYRCPCGGKLKRIK